MANDFKVKKTVRETETKTTITYDFAKNDSDSTTISGSVEEVVANLNEKKNEAE